MTTTRREFMIGCSAAIAAYAARSTVHAGFLPAAAFRASSGAIAGANTDAVVVIFLRGGMDSLHMLGPANDKDYIAARPANLRVTDAGDQEGLSLGDSSGGGAGLDFRIHKNAAPLKELFEAKHLAFIHACGLTNGTRSHFEAMDLVERGVAETGQQNLASGWITRHLSALAGLPAQGQAVSMLPALAADDSLPASLLGFPKAAASKVAERFGLWGGDAQREALATLYAPGLPLHEPAQQALSILKAVNERLPRNKKGEVEKYQPQHGAKYPEGQLAQSLQTVARMLKTDLGVRVATVDFGGWDTHQDQTYLFPVRLRELASALHAFHTDMTDHHSRLTVVVQSEFGRRLKANKSNGTDHGHGAAMMVLGGNIAGGKIHGSWPGLATDQLDSRADLAVTTDYRQVLGEIILKRQGNAKLGEVFPGLKQYTPLGVVNAHAEAPTSAVL
ncbi:MAG: DUF1501 domain-containing protein [Planctomycetota bacterium]